MRGKGYSEGSDGHGGGPVRLLIADDHPLLREALKMTVGGAPGLEVSGEAADGREALELCRRLRPDLVLMDVRMPVMDGIAAARAIKREFPQTVVLFLTAQVDPDHLAEAIRAGAAGYVLKDAPPKELIGAVRAALKDRSPINRELAMGLLQRLLAVNPDEGEEREEAFPAAAPSASSSSASEESPDLTLAHRLTPREIEVLLLVARGRTNQQIAKRLLLSVSTVKKHVRSVIAKLGVSDRTQAAIRAIELGLPPGQEDKG